MDQTPSSLYAGGRVARNHRTSPFHAARHRWGISSAAFFGRAGNAAGGRLERQSLACHRRRRRYALFIVELWLLTYPTIKIRAFIPVLGL